MRVPTLFPKKALAAYCPFFRAPRKERLAVEKDNAGLCAKPAGTVGSVASTECPRL